MMPHANRLIKLKMEGGRGKEGAARQAGSSLSQGCVLKTRWYLSLDGWKTLRNNDEYNLRNDRDI